MANTKISQLPTWTGSANDLRWFVMNNSGNNETYKFSGYTSPFIVDAGNSIFSTFGTPAVYDADCVGSIIIGSEAAGYDDYTTLVGWKAIGNNDIEGRCSAFGADANATSRFSTALGMSTRATGSFSTAVGHNASAGAGNSTAVGATSNASGSNSVSVGYGISSPSPYDINIGGSGKTFSDTYGGNVSIGGDTNIMSGTRGFKTIINGSNNEITGTAKWASIFGGRNNRIADGDYGMTIIGGEYNYINSSAYGSAIIATASSTLTQAGTTLLGGGYSNSVSNSNDCVSIGGRSNQLTNNYQTGGSANIAGESNSLTGNLCAIIGGNNNTITGGTHQVMIGCSGRTATTQSATFVENLVVFNYAALNFVDDTAAAAGGVVLGQVYHTGGVLKIRIV